MFWRYGPPLIVVLFKLEEPIPCRWVRFRARILDLAHCLSANADKIGEAQLREKRFPAQGPEPYSDFRLLPRSRVGVYHLRFIERNSKRSLEYAKFTATHRKPLPPLP
jgi:hypothetical protein